MDAQIYHQIKNLVSTSKPPRQKVYNINITYNVNSTSSGNVISGDNINTNV